MEVSIIGSGYVGTTIAACLADAGHDVTAIDVDPEIVAAIQAGRAPIDEPQLDELIDRHSGGRLRATTEYAVVPETELTVLTLTTPSNPDGSLDTTILERGTEMLGESLADTDEHTVVVKSTVVPGTTRNRLTPILERESGLTAGESLHVAANPEFLSQGSAVGDFTAPDKLVFGADDEHALRALRDLYAPLETDAAAFETTPATAETIKYANNAFLAAKVSLINDIGNVCKEFGVDAYEVAEALGADDRIGDRFLRSGLGWGGSCFPKDVAAIRHAARERDYDPAMLAAAAEVNDRQPRRLLALMDRHVDVSGRRVAVLGLAFKPGTDDTRGSRAVPVIEGLQARNADVAAYDPAAIANARERFPEITYAETAAEAVRDAAAALVVTEWPEIAALDEAFDRMATPVVVDGRRAIDRREGIVYEGLTW